MESITQGFKFCKWKNAKKRIEYYENQLDTSTPTGKLVFHVIRAVAEFEKDIIHERVRAGLSKARRKGKLLGRPPIAAIRQRHLALDLSFQDDEPIRMSKIPEVSTRMATAYAKKTRRTMDRDVNKLIDMGLMERTKDGIRAKRDL
ncbi:MAG: recombinase family protein, partial [Deltaproteobacteria bacterium]|nr:recombinase family protein [Deltaproteobacteria bacterium]